ncbi:chemotaxis protein [Thalassospira profundimaris]|uniref:Protein-glutamate methylesterase/protein-glutamine glutaminase n=1 Tax=Thalassospira profundimaris TaxID=502049 RepID=A0A367WPP4_9PROT|nr:chemotaxis protein CheB [Thalassospira profundimaris]RCK43445.1 chemotaxis protein [Thalassospira profundimaris]
MEQNHIDPPYKVLIVDDSAIVRGLVARMLQDDSDIEVVGSVANGEDALAVMRDGGVEAVVLDIEMPVMDGLTALPKILEIDPTVRVIMASTLTKRNADISFKAMTLGAVDYIPKPSSAKDINVGSGFRSELVDKVKAWSEQRRKMLEQAGDFDEIDEFDEETAPVDASVPDPAGKEPAGDKGAVTGDISAEDTSGDAVVASEGDRSDSPSDGGEPDGAKPFRAEMSIEHQVLQKPGRIQRKRFTAELRPRPMQHPMQQQSMRPQMRPMPADPAPAREGGMDKPGIARLRDPGRLIEEAAVAAKKAGIADALPGSVATPFPAGKPHGGAKPETARSGAGTSGARRAEETRARPASPNREVPAHRAEPQPARPREERAKRAVVAGNAPAPARRGRSQGQVTLQPEKHVNVEAIAIGSSTGGPQALFEVLRGLVGVRQPIFITQHMPATFTTILAEHITRLTGLKCGEGVNGEPVQPGRVYLAPGDFHMVVEGRGNNRKIALNQNPPENFCRPSVDPMLRSLVESYGGNMLTIILTGMGQDGMLGGRNVVAAGGMVVAQDEATSVVWGMPGAAAHAGICSAILPIGGIAPYVKKFAGGR